MSPVSRGRCREGIISKPFEVPALRPLKCWAITGIRRRAAAMIRLRANSENPSMARRAALHWWQLSEPFLLSKIKHSRDALWNWFRLIFFRGERPASCPRVRNSRRIFFPSGFWWWVANRQALQRAVNEVSFSFLLMENQFIDVSSYDFACIEEYKQFLVHSACGFIRWATTRQRRAAQARQRQISGSLSGSVVTWWWLVKYLSVTCYSLETLVFAQKTRCNYLKIKELRGDSRIPKLYNYRCNSFIIKLLKFTWQHKRWKYGNLRGIFLIAVYK